ncbi:hypothetical protein JX266_001577 [Neoarthrinium moseri]|uniref:uncharacterized protein n=1 Tax=Neoarthrinium moseri TaxID=1658444 RepID=UPI001FDC6244|nr:uncharacterized protein JN550_008739 [Neoarthrinium moseri]KAI1853593.1 hypothetical protein JX266_001577 [Neoarthrinium moseri]KAI1864919.1 hypothetical protein JN550_008739 [Neoarthrinium moseri]
MDAVHSRPPDLTGQGVVLKKRRRGATRRRTAIPAKRGILDSAWPVPTRNSATSRNEPERSPTLPTSTWDLFNGCIPNAGLNSAPDTAIITHSSPSPSSTASTAGAVTPQSLPPPEPGPVSIDAETAHLLAKYKAGVATWMDIFDHGCSYQREVPRRSLTSELLMKSICAFTAKHLSLLPSGQIWAAPASTYYGDALRLLIRHLASDAPHEDALTATILLSSYEMVAAQGQEHKRHFHGAMVLIMSRGISARSLGMDRANFWIYVRHEITVALVNETTLQIDPSKWHTSWQEGNVEEDVLGNQLLCLVGRAINVVYGPGSPDPMSNERQAIQTDAETWSRSLPASFRGVNYGMADDRGFHKRCFAVPSAALADVPQSVRSFSPQALFIAAKHVHGIDKKTALWALLGDVETRHGFSTRSRVKKLQQLVEPGRWYNS